MRKTTFPAVFATFILCMAVWIFITWSFDVRELAAGVLVSIAAALFSSRFFIHRYPFQLFNPRRVFGAIVYAFVFVWEVIKANCSMAARVFGECRVNPGIVRIPTDFDTEYSLAALANSITLTPGTITMDIADVDGKNCMYVHWIDVTAESGEAAGEVIKGTLEKNLWRIFR